MRLPQLGQRIQPGAPLMTIVPLDSLWVEANFKENQLDAMRPGQKATLISDLYGSKTVYHGTVVGVHKIGTTRDNTMYSVRQHDHHPGEPAVLHHSGKALTVVDP